jgi:hypothetical protein
MEQVASGKEMGPFPRGLITPLETLLYLQNETSVLFTPHMFLPF